MINFLTNYWWVLLVAIAAGVVIGYAIYKFIKLPTSAQIAKVKEWLLYAVAEAERILGSGTGQIKLRYVYDMFICRFPFLTNVISFEKFSTLVDEALEKFKDLIDGNNAVKDYVSPEGESRDGLQ